MYHVLEYLSGVTYKVGEYPTKAEAVSALQDKGVWYDMDTDYAGEVAWNKNFEGFKIKRIGFRMWIREVK